MTALVIVLAIVAGYVIGVMQGGIHIYTNKKPVAPVVENEETQSQYNEDYSSLLPPEMQEYFKKNSGFIK